MVIDWSSEFDGWLDRLIARADGDDARAEAQLDLVYAQLTYLQDLKGEPLDDTPTLKRVRQSRGYPVWRVAHPFVEGVAVRLIVWFLPDRPAELVVALFAGDKANMGDVFYDSVGTRADAAVSRYLMATEGEGHG
jgi:hypothetical protein